MSNHPRYLHSLVRARVVGVALLVLAALAAVTATSATAAAPLPTAQPAITGTSRILSTLTCTPGAWDQEAAFGFEWLVDDAPVDGATTNTFDIPVVDRGHRIACRITATNAEPAATVATSAEIVPTKALQLVTGNFQNSSGANQSCGVGIARACAVSRASGSTVAVGGVLAPARAGAKVVVVLERARGKLWVLSMTRTVVIASSGSYSISIPARFFSAATWRVRTRVPETDVYDLAQSPLRYLRVAL